MCYISAVRETRVNLIANSFEKVEQQLTNTGGVVDVGAVVGIVNNEGFALGDVLAD